METVREDWGWLEKVGEGWRIWRRSGKVGEGRGRLKNLPAVRNTFFYLNLDNSTLVPPTGFLLSEDLGATPSFILTEYDQSLRVLRGRREGLTPSKKV